MKVAILTGGFGTRISDDATNMPKPMIGIGEMPILWHIMKLYSYYGVNDFVLLLGYKGYMIKEYFANYYLHKNDLVIDLKNNQVQYINNHSEPWKITLLDTGLNTMTGGRLLRARHLLEQEPFMLTYGDGVSDVNLTSLLEFHQKSNTIATMTAVLPEGRYGAVEVSSAGRVNSFLEKPQGDGHWVNGGFFVFQPQIFNYLKDGDATTLERDPLEALVRDQQLSAFVHSGFWKCMDTPRDKNQLNSMWPSNAPWKVWND